MCRANVDFLVTFFFLYLFMNFFFWRNPRCSLPWTPRQNTATIRITIRRNLKALTFELLVIRPSLATRTNKWWMKVIHNSRVMKHMRTRLMMADVSVCTFFFFLECFGWKKYIYITSKKNKKNSYFSLLIFFYSIKFWYSETFLT